MKHSVKEQRRRIAGRFIVSTCELGWLAALCALGGCLAGRILP